MVIHICILRDGPSLYRQFRSIQLTIRVVERNSERIGLHSTTVVIAPIVRVHDITIKGMGMDGAQQPKLN